VRRLRALAAGRIAAGRIAPRRVHAARIAARRVPAGLRALAAAGAAATLAASAGGCATVPTGGAPHAMSDAAGQPQAYVQPLPPPPPEPWWKPRDVVLAFLHASASFALDPAAARQYLAPGPERAHWTPPGAVTVVGPSLSFTNAPPPVAVRAGQSDQFAQITATGQQVATLSVTGQYSYQPGTASYTFRLEKDNGIWLIENPPSLHPLPAGQASGLLLTESDFHLLYQPRNLYFFASGGSGRIVPDPVFAPLQGVNSALNTNLATGLVKALKADKGSWLSVATQTAFPAGTTLHGPVRISNGTAVVRLGGAAATAPSATVAEMYEQLCLTLTSGTYSTPVADAVSLQLWAKNRLLTQRSGACAADEVPAVGSASEPLYFVSGQDTVSRLIPGTTPTVAVGPAEVGTDISAMAVSGGQQPEIAVAGPDGGGCGLSVAPAHGAASWYPLSRRGGACTSLSWDGNGDLWAAAGNRVWVLSPGPHATPAQVNVAQLAAAVGGGSKFRVLELRMAPDSVRAAILVQDKAGGNQVLLAAVADEAGSFFFGRAVPVGGSSLSDPTALAWYNPYFLLVLNGAELLQAPLTGGAAQDVGPVPATSGMATSIATNGSALVVGTSADQVWISSQPDSSWHRIGPRGAAYGLPGYPA
jgi:hypothetical protein